MLIECVEILVFQFVRDFIFGLFVDFVRLCMYLNYCVVS